MKQTAVEWFYQRILAKDIQSVFEQAKAMEIASKLTAFTAGPYISKEQPKKIK